MKASAALAMVNAALALGLIAASCGGDDHPSKAEFVKALLARKDAEKSC